VERRRGDQSQAIEYCSKEASRVLGPWRIGEPAKGQGFRTDINELAQAIVGGVSRRELVQQFPTLVLKFARGIEYARNIVLESPPWRDLRCFYLYGPTGTGKSSFVYSTHGHSNVYTLPSARHTWFDQYDGQQVLFIDEYSNGLERETLLRWLDGHPLQVQVKGGHVAARWTYVYVVSNENWYEWWDAALKRRFASGGVFELSRQRGAYDDLVGYVKGERDRPVCQLR